MTLNHKHIFYITLGIIAGLLLALGGFVAWMDPYQQFGAHPDRYCGNQREEIAGIAMHHDYNAIVTGSSMAMNHYPQQIDSLFGWKTKNFSMMGATFDDYNVMLPHVLNVGKAKNIILGIDFFSFARQRCAISPYLYDTNIWNNYEYLFNYTALETAINVAKGNFSKEENLYHFNSEVSYQALKKNYTDHKNGYEGENFDFNLMKSKFDNTLNQIVKNSPQNVTWHIYYPPYNVYEFIVYKNTGVLNDILKFKSYITAQLLPLNNVHLYDFQCAPWINNMNEYMDLRHHSHAYNRAIIRAIHDNQYRISSPNSSHQHLHNLIAAQNDTITR